MPPRKMFQVDLDDYHFPQTSTRSPVATSGIPPPPSLPEPRRALAAWTAGGDHLDIRLPDVSFWHYSQEDASLNSEIWDLFPVDKTEAELGRDMDAAHRTLAAKDPGVAQYNFGLLANGIRTFEKATIAASLLTLCEVHRGLSKGGKAVRHPLEALAHRKKTKNVSSLQDMIAVAQLRKSDGDALFDGGDTWSAIQEYTEALLSLYPWVPTRLLFSGQDAFVSGLAQLHATLWLQLAEATKVRDRTLTARGITTFNWQIVVFQAASVVANTTFVDRYTLSQAFQLLAETNAGFSKTISSVTSYSEHAFTEAALDAKEWARCQEYLADLIMNSHLENHANRSDPWAHRDCVDVHSGCGCDSESVRKLLQPE